MSLSCFRKEKKEVLRVEEEEKCRQEESADEKALRMVFLTKQSQELQLKLEEKTRELSQLQERTRGEKKTPQTKIDLTDEGNSGIFFWRRGERETGVKERERKEWKSRGW